MQGLEFRDKDLTRGGIEFKAYGLELGFAC